MGSHKQSHHSLSKKKKSVNLATEWNLKLHVLLLQRLQQWWLGGNQRSTEQNVLPSASDAHSASPSLFCGLLSVEIIFGEDLFLSFSELDSHNKLFLRAENISETNPEKYAAQEIKTNNNSIQSNSESDWTMTEVSFLGWTVHLKLSANVKSLSECFSI